MNNAIFGLVIWVLVNGCGVSHPKQVHSQPASVPALEHGACAVPLTTPQLVKKLAEVRGTLGCPVSLEESDPFGEGLSVTLEKGALFWRSKAPAAYALHGKILEKFLEMGGPGFQLGYPTSDVFATAHSQGLVARFEKGAVSVLPGKEPVVTIMVPGITWR